MGRYNYNGTVLDRALRLLMIDPDSRRCSARLNEFAKLESIGDVFCAARADEVLGQDETETFDACIFSVEDRPAGSFQDEASMIVDIFGELKIIATESPERPDQIVPYIEAGAWDYVARNQSTMTLIRKLHLSAAGRSELDPPVTAALMDRIHELAQLRTPSLNGSNGIGTLTPREKEVLALISRRMTNREIAEELVLEVGTVKNHVHNLLNKLEVDNRYEAAALNYDDASTRVFASL